MQIESLKTFVDVVETRSFSKAAGINGVTQSAVSQMVQALEKQFGSLLIERGSRKLSLTPKGMIIYDTAKIISLEIEEMNQKLSTMKG